MHRQSTRIGLRIATVGLAALFGVLVGASNTDARDDEDAAEANAEDLEDHEADSEDPEDDLVGSEDPDERTVGSEDPEDRLTGSEDSDSMLEGSEDIDDHMADSEELPDLPEARPDSGDDPIDVPGQSRWQPTTDPEVLVARNNLLRAEQRAEAATAVYGDMSKRNYPRGEARIRIVNERDEAIKALEEAKQALAAAEE
jgi:hypothetical protein